MVYFVLSFLSKAKWWNNLIPHCGYIHRGIEKMCEKLTYQQIIHLTDRMDYLSAHMNNECVSLVRRKCARDRSPGKS